MMRTRHYYLQKMSRSVTDTRIRMESQGIIVHRNRLSPVSRQIKRELMEWIVLRQYWDNGITAELLASQAGASKEEVDMFIWSLTGKKLSTVRKELRLEDAKFLLNDKPELSAAEVGRMVGYNDKSDFRKHFMEAENCSPLEWREKNLASGSDRNHCQALDTISKWLNSMGWMN